MKQFGLIGFPLSHSFSEAYFNEKFFKENICDTEYHFYPIEDLNTLPDFIAEHQDLIGLNITIPHKINILNHLDELDHDAAQVGAVNTIKIKRSLNKTTIKGYNTDIYGFEQSLKPLLSKTTKRALIFGNGGAALAVKYVFSKLEIPFTSVVRTKENSNQYTYKELTNEIISSHHIIINTTPVGMFPDCDGLLEFPTSAISSQHLLFDLIYNPAKTMFLKLAEAKGAVGKNGMEMLIFQAEKAWDIWNNKD